MDSRLINHLGGRRWYVSIELVGRCFVEVTQELNFELEVVGLNSPQNARGRLPSIQLTRITVANGYSLRLIAGQIKPKSSIKSIGLAHCSEIEPIYEDCNRVSYLPHRLAKAVPAVPPQLELSCSCSGDNMRFAIRISS